MLGPSSAAQKENVSTFGPTSSTAAANRKWLIAVGIILMLTGIGAIAFPFAGVLAIDRIVATVFTISGLVYLGHSIAVRRIRGFAWELVLGILYLLAGLSLFARPIDSVVVLTAIIALSLIADGLFRTAVAITMRRGPWGWFFASGIIAIILGLTIFALPAGNAVLMIAALVGLNLLASGMAYVMVGASTETKAATTEQR
ncbi:MAG: DUF308 domain-containing protein [Filomicrobium sp.]